MKTSKTTSNTAEQNLFKSSFDAVTNFYKSMPKTPAETTAVIEKVQGVLKAEFDNTQEVFSTYVKLSKGDATVNEIAAANKKAAELVKSTTFAGMLAIPGALFMLPIIVNKAKEHNIDLVPASVAEHFDI